VWDLVPLIVPLLNGGIDRAMALAEVLESRGFGAIERDGGRGTTWLGGMLLASTAVLAFAVTAGRGSVALAALGVIAATGVGLARRPRPTADGGGRTRYREVRLRPADWLVGACSVVAGAVTVVGERRMPGAVTYEPYPRLASPDVSVPVLCGLLLLFVPVLVLAPADRATT